MEILFAGLPEREGEGAGLVGLQGLKNIWVLSESQLATTQEE